MIELKEIDAHLLSTSTPEEECLFQARLILDAGLAEKVRLQQKTHQLVHQYGRKKLKEEIGLAQIQFFNDPVNRGLVNRITRLFRH